MTLIVSKEVNVLNIFTRFEHRMAAMKIKRANMQIKSNLSPSSEYSSGKLPELHPPFIA
jgi:hypothetical protein